MSVKYSTMSLQFGKKDKYKITLQGEEKTINRHYPDRLEFYDENYKLTKRYKFVTDGSYSKKEYSLIEHEHFTADGAGLSQYFSNKKNDNYKKHTSKYRTFYDVQHQYNGKFTIVISKLIALDEEGKLLNVESTVNAFDTVGSKVVSYISPYHDINTVYITPDLKNLIFTYGEGHRHEMSPYESRGVELIDLVSNQKIYGEFVHNDSDEYSSAINTNPVNHRNRIVYDTKYDNIEDTGYTGTNVIIDPKTRTKYVYHMTLERAVNTPSFILQDIQMYFDSLDYDEKINF